MGHGLAGGVSAEVTDKEGLVKILMKCVSSSVCRSRITSLRGQT